MKLSKYADFFSTPPTHMATEYGDNMINVSCIANTSEPCSYRWKATEVRTNNPLDIHRQTISLIPKNYDDLKCFAKCRLANKDCSTQPMDWKLSLEAGTEDGSKKGEGPYILFYCPGSPPLWRYNNWHVKSSNLYSPCRFHTLDRCRGEWYRISVRAW